MIDDEDEFNQCPHEMVRATCPGCNCECTGCDRWREREAARLAAHLTTADQADGEVSGE